MSNPLHPGEPIEFGHLIAHHTTTPGPGHPIDPPRPVTVRARTYAGQWVQLETVATFAHRHHLVIAQPWDDRTWNAIVEKTACRFRPQA